MRAALLACLAALLLAACATDQAPRPLPDLGAFQLGHNVVVASKMQKGPVSRDATAEEWQDVLRKEVANRFGRLEGDQFYHIAISVEGFMLAPTGVPLVYKPKSALIVNVTVWDDAAGRKLNEKVKQFTAFETTTGDSFIVGSGATRTREEQMAGLARNAVRQIEDWLIVQRNEAGWFAPRPDAAPEAPLSAPPLTED